MFICSHVTCRGHSILNRTFVSLWYFGSPVATNITNCLFFYYISVMHILFIRKREHFLEIRPLLKIETNKYVLDSSKLACPDVNVLFFVHYVSVIRNRYYSSYLYIYLFQSTQY